MKKVDNKAHLLKFTSQILQKFFYLTYVFKKNPISDAFLSVVLQKCVYDFSFQFPSFSTFLIETETYLFWLTNSAPTDKEM